MVATTGDYERELIGSRRQGESGKPSSHRMECAQPFREASAGDTESPPVMRANPVRSRKRNHSGQPYPRMGLWSRPALLPQ